jgi:hypothetical protein
VPDLQPPSARDFAGLHPAFPYAAATRNSFAQSQLQEDFTNVSF